MTDKKLGIVGEGLWGELLLDLAHKNTGGVLLYRTGEMSAEGAEEVDGLEALGARCRLIMIATTFETLPRVASELGDHLKGHHRLVHTLQGLECGTGRRASEILRAMTPVRQVGALVGPFYPAMYHGGQPCGAIAGSEFPEVIGEVQKMLAKDRLRVYGSRDLRGVELAAAAVQVFAVAFGFAEKMGYGASVRGMLMARGLAELSRLVEICGGSPRTAFGMAGLGSLVSQVEAPGSTAYQLGVQLSAGEGGVDLLKGKVASEVAETSVWLSRKASACGVEAHITSAVSRLLSGEMAVDAVLGELFALRQMME